MFTKPLHYLGFDNAFVSFCPGMCLVPVEKKNLCIYCLGVGLWTEKPQEGKKHLYIC